MTEEEISLNVEEEDVTEKTMETTSMNGAVVTGGVDGELKFWDLRTRPESVSTLLAPKSLYVWRRHVLNSQQVQILSLKRSSPTRMYIGCDNGSIGFMDVEKFGDSVLLPDEYRIFEKYGKMESIHRGKIHAMDYCSKNNLLLTASGDNTIQTTVWKCYSDDESRRRTELVVKDIHGISCVTFYGGSSSFAYTNGRGIVHVVDSDRKKTIFAHSSHQLDVFGMEYDNERQLLWSCSMDRTVSGMDMRCGKVVFSLEGHRNWLRSIRLHDQYLAVGEGKVGGSNSMYIYDCRELKPGKQFRSYMKKLKNAHQDEIRGIEFLPDRGLLMTVGHTRLKFWNLNDFKLKWKRNEHLNSIYACCVFENFERFPGRMEEEEESEEEEEEVQEEEEEENVQDEREEEGKKKKKTEVKSRLFKIHNEMLKQEIMN